MDFLYIITKQEFTSLYRFGFIPVIQEKVLELKGLSEKEIETDIIKSFLSLPFFVGDEEYLFISFGDFPSSDNKIFIENVLEVIPLTSAARHSYQMKFDKKIVFSQAKFEKIINKVEEQIDIQERLNGAKAFWTLCKVQEPYKELINSEKINEVYNCRINGLKSDNFTSDYFVHALVYERYEFFPNSDLGFLYDVGEIFAHSKQKQSFRGSGYYKFLEQNKPIFENKNLLDLVGYISKASEIVKFTEQLTINDLKHYIVAALFFKFKSDLQEKDSIKGSETGKIIGTLRSSNQFIPELNTAIFLTGLFFGYEKFYDDLYALTGLHIFKSFTPTAETNLNHVRESKEELKTEKEKSTEKTVQAVNEPNKVELPIQDEVEQAKTVDKTENDLQSQVKELIEKSGGKIQVKGDSYKEIQKLVRQNCKDTKGFKKSDYLSKIAELTESFFEIDVNKGIIKLKDNPDLFANA
ncbi:MAG TPA: hypothetical protein VLZ83_17270 [Edaphocola sp.]|nr:hypothetical protein [Edaphocola sp.]